MKGLRIIIAGGGTGGHIFPAVAIAHALEKLLPDVQLLFVGAKGRMEMEKIPQEGYEIIGLDIAGFNRSNLLKNFSLPYRLVKSYFKARRILKSFNPNVVIGVGGYASFPILNAAQGTGIPTVIQEQNSFAGKSNKILGRRASAICVAYEGMDKFFPKERLFMTGNPVRRNIAQSVVSREEGQAWFGLEKDRKTVLILGGSLGARSINRAMEEHLENILEGGVQIIWQTGKAYYEQAKAKAGKFNNVKVYEFIREMDKAYAACDVLVSRAGALAIAEICIAAKPVIFVPFPYAAEDHQTSNALALVKHNAAEIIKDSDVQSELAGKLKKLLKDELMQDVMIRNLKAMAIRDADERIANKVLEIANSN